jgi:hypothetical protein
VGGSHQQPPQQDVPLLRDGELGSALPRVSCESLLEDSESPGRRILSDELDRLIEGSLSARSPDYSAPRRHLLAPQFLLNLLMENSATLVEFSDALFDLGDHVEVVEDILQRALVREAIEKFTNRFLGLHGSSRALALGTTADDSLAEDRSRI